MTLQLSSFGTRLTARALGVRILGLCNETIRQGDSIVFDLNGVESMSTGFAKELFGGLLESLQSSFPERVSFIFGDNRDHLLAEIRRGMSVVSKTRNTQSQSRFVHS